MTTIEKELRVRGHSNGWMLLKKFINSLRGDKLGSLPIVPPFDLKTLGKIKERMLGDNCVVPGTNPWDGKLDHKR